MTKRIAAGCLALLLVSASLTGCTSGIRPAGPEVTVYSSRHYAADHLLYQAFTEQTGIRVTEVKGTPHELLERLRQEGEDSPADVFITVDAAPMVQAKRDGLLQPLDRLATWTQVPARWRDDDGQWIGLTARARVIVYAKDRVDEGVLRSYDDLADPRWRGHLLMRSPTNHYNVSLLASLISEQGEAAARTWADAIGANLAGPPEGGDREQALRIAEGAGDVSVMNSYYIAQMLESDDEEEREAAAGLGIVFPDQTSGGTHVNLSALGVLQHAPHSTEARQLLEYLTSPAAQSILSARSYEYPVHPAAELPAVLRSWGRLEPQAIDFDNLADGQQLASELLVRAGW